MNDWFEAEKRVERAHELYESGRWEDAARELKAAIGVNPYQGEWHFNLGLTLEALGRFNEAVDAFRRAADCQGDDIELLNSIAVNCMRLDRLDDAQEYLERAQQLDPSDPLSYANRVELYGRKDDDEAAEQMFYLAVQADESCTRAYLNIAPSLSRRGEHDRAIWCLEHLLELDPSDEQVHARLGHICWAKGDHERAYASFIQQLRYFPGDLDTMLDAGNLLVVMDRPAEAAEKFRRAIELDPTNADAHFCIGELAMRTGHLDSARKALNAALKCDEHRLEVHQRLAQVALRMGERKLAREHLKAELNQPHHGRRSDESADELGQLLLDAHMPAKAAEMLGPLVEKQGNDPRLVHQYAVSLLMQGELRRGMRLCRRALRYDDQMVMAMHNLALGHMQLKQFGRARLYIRQATRAQPRDKQLRSLRRQWARQLLKHMARRVFRWD